MKKVYLVAVCLFILSPGVAHAGEVLFETTLPWYYSWIASGFGTGSDTRTAEMAIRYTPISNQEVCKIKPGLYKLGNPIDSVVLNVKEDSIYPSSGSIIRTTTVLSDQVANPPIVGNQSTYTTFTFSPCLKLTANTNYSFVFSRTQLPNYNTPDFKNFYALQISNLIYSAQTAVWAYVPINYYWQENYNYEPALRLEGPDAKEPVIIVPGILGSRLNRTSDGEEVWPNVGKMSIPGPDDYLNDLKLDNNGNEILDINLTEIIESVLFINQYGNLIQKFKDNGYLLGENLFVIPYDWRLDITQSSHELDPIIAKAIANSFTGKVNIIAHSMGGLLVKDYLIRNGESAVNKVIFAGTPNLGAPKAFNLLNYGDDFDLRFLGLGLNKDKAKDIGQNMPAVYELLPSRDYFAKAGPYVKDDNALSLNYDQTGQLMATGRLLADQRNPSLLAIADDFHKTHDRWLPKLANVYNLLGCSEYDTIGSFELEKDGSVDINSVSGDGTVPLVSAEHVPGQNYFVSYPQTKINHVGLISDDRMIDLLYNIISSGSSFLLNGIYQTADHCDDIINQVRRLRFSTHSPVNLHVYDGAGNHTGLKSDGNIELGIPDSDFVQVGDNTFIFVPDGETYSIKIGAYATGSFDFKVKTLINGEVDKSLIINDVPINSLNLKANFEFSGIESVASLEVDRDGDGVIDAGYLSDGSWMPRNATIQSTLNDLSRIYLLGWISGEVKNSLRSLLLAMLPTETATKSKGKQADGVLGMAFLKQMEMEYNKGNINEKGFNIIKVDILWLLGN